MNLKMHIPTPEMGTSAHGRKGLLDLSRARLLSVVRERFRLLQILRFGARGPTAVLIASIFTLFIAPSAMALATASLVNALSKITRREGLLVDSLPAVLIFASVILIAELAALLSEGLRARVIESIDGQIQADIRQHVTTKVAFSVLESDSGRSLIARAWDPGSSWRNRTAGAASVGAAVVLFRFGGAIASAIVLATTAPVLAAAVLVAAISVRTRIRSQWLRLAKLEDSLLPRRQCAESLESAFRDPDAARDLRIYALHEWMLDRWTGASANAWNPYRSQLTRVLRRQTLTTLIVFSIVFLSFGLLSVQSMLGNLDSAGLAQSFVAVVGVLGISYMGYEALDIDYGVPGLRAYEEVMGDVTVSPTRVTQAFEDSRARTLIRLSAVAFAYPGADATTLGGIDLAIAEGETVAVVGPSASGKTTLTKLIAGLYEPTSGSIERRTGATPEATPNMAVVYQDFVRYPVSLEENISLGVDLSLANRARLTRSMSRAGLLVRAPNEELELISSEAALSGGQWQRVALARALFAAEMGAKLIILDEPTAQLDADAEAAFYDKVIGRTKDVAVLLISHRLATVRNSDRILYLDDGVIKESGSHEELMQKAGAYAASFNLQASRFEQGTRRAVGQ